MLTLMHIVDYTFWCWCIVTT